MPNTTDKSIFPGIGLTCHFIAGATSENPELPDPRTFAEYVGTSSSSSRQGAIPKRHRLFVPSMVRLRSRALKFHPVLTLKAAHGHDQAGVRDIRPVRRDFILGGWTGVRLCVDRTEDRKRGQPTCLESSFGHGNLDRSDS
jgi:hypothetical protein